jgi:diguanylate cyclase (GGDEF)-like protein
MFKKTKIISTTLIVALGFVLILFAGDYFQNKVKELQTLAYTKDSNEIKKQLQNMIEEKQKATIAISIALAQSSLIKEFLHNGNYKKNIKNLHNLSAELRKSTSYKNVWLHIISPKGVSLARSWSDKRGDSLLNVREDIKKLVKHPTQTSGISVGKYTISFKAIACVRDKHHKLLGFIEIITHFNSISKELQRQNYDSVLLVDKKYKKQLVNNLTQEFIDDYYVANFHTKNYALALLRGLDLKHQTLNSNYLISKHYYFTTYPIYNNDKQAIAYFILIKDINYFDYEKRDDFINTVEMLLVLSLIVMLLIIILLYTYSAGINKQRKYFHNIVDTASEIIIITDGYTALDINEAFFIFFDEYKTLQEFTKQFKCICDLFIKEDGYISKQIGELTWFEFILAHPKDSHKAKILYKNKIFIFTIHLKILEQTNTNIYTLALSDITQSELYKDRLEHISQTDMLTGIGNRYKFDEDIHREIFRAKRYRSALSLIMLDIDFFKKVNDTYGHDAGDNVLIALSKEIGSLLRYSDIFCRYGGEEFIIIMPEITLIESKISANRIRKHIEELHIKGVGKITISLGVTELKENDNITSLLKRVDKALYISKEEGRNKVSSL